jgi:DNA-binding transcriptional ArsR family regulator
MEAVMTSERDEQGSPTLEWDLGTAYDFFISYRVLANPKRFGVRSAWASGMRARLQPADRETLDTSLLVLPTAGQWLHTLPSPKDVVHALRALAEIPAAQRLRRMACWCEDAEHRSPTQNLVYRVWHEGGWDDETLKKYRELRSAGKHSHQGEGGDEKLKTILNTWANAEMFGERYLQALHSYHDVFFAEEERRIASTLEEALEKAQARAEELSFADLMEELSHGIRYESTVGLDRLTLVPSYWVSPFVQVMTIRKGHRMWAFGARPAQDSIVPGDPVPDALRVSLKALADPTRLRILRYLHREPLTLSELTKQLRLRMPTVIHHISALRLAGLVSIHVQGEEKGRRPRYGTRTDGLAAAVQSLKEFIEDDQASP